MSYVDGFVAAVPEANLDAYREMAAKVWEVFRENGAQEMVECWADDVPEGKITSFPMAVKAEPGEAVVFAWIRWPSRAVRDAGQKATFEDSRLNADMTLSLFDGMRMIFGGFEVIFEGRDG